MLKKEWNKHKNGSMKEYTFYSNRKVWWICSKGKCADGKPHEWQTIISNRTGKNPKGCPICAVRVICKYDHCNTLEYSASKSLKKEWDEKKNGPMTQYFPCSQQKVWWKCSKNHKWNAIIGSRTSTNSSGCPKM